MWLLLNKLFFREFFGNADDCLVVVILIMLVRLFERQFVSISWETGVQNQGHLGEDVHFVFVH